MDNPVNDSLRAIVQRTYRLPGKRLLLLDDGYEGGAEPGEWIEVAIPGGRALRVQVENVAWGSSFRADNPPLTLIVHWSDELDPEPGAEVRGVPPPPG